MAGQKVVGLTESAAARVAAATIAHERGTRNMTPVMFRDTAFDHEPVRIGKTQAQWSKGTLAVITVYESGSPGSETTSTPATYISGCVNKFATVQANKWVALARGLNGSYYLIAAEC